MLLTLVENVEGLFSENWALEAPAESAGPTMLRICALNESSSEDEVGTLTTFISVNCLKNNQGF